MWAKLDIEHRYDSAGNRSVEIVPGSRKTFTYDAANQVTGSSMSMGSTTYHYDAAGNLTQKTTPVTDTYYTWTSRNWMATAETVAGVVSFVYDGLGKRILKDARGVIRRYVWDNEKLLQETACSPSGRCVSSGVKIARTARRELVHECEREDSVELRPDPPQRHEQRGTGHDPRLRHAPGVRFLVKDYRRQVRDRDCSSG